MQAMGYDNTTKWTAAIHDDSDKQHVHVVTSRVKNEPSCPLVSDSNDFEKGFSVMREMEKTFNLQQLQSPSENWGKEFTKEEIKAGASRLTLEDDDVKDDAVIIRRRFNDLWKSGKPKTMPDLINALTKRGIETRIRTNSTGDPTGISYRVKGREAWISGSKVKSTRSTWTRLTSAKGESISYKPWRDNLALGLPEIKKPEIQKVENIGPKSFSAYIKLTSYQHKRLKISKRHHNVYQVPRKGLIACIDFSLMMSPTQRRSMALAQQAVDLTKLIIEALKEILEALFGKAQVLDIQDDTWSIPNTWKPQNDLKGGHSYAVSGPDLLKMPLDLQFELDEETQWRRRIPALNLLPSIVIMDWL